MKKFLDHVKSDPLSAAYVLAATTGMRRGEVLGLRWQDLDLEVGRALIEQTLIVVGGYEVQYSETKTARGRRMIALDPQTVKALKQQRERQMLDRSLMGDSYQDADLVFAHGDGTWIHPDGF